MLSQFMVLFGFFALVLVSIVWINKAVRMFDRLIADGQSAWVFLEFTALTLPGVIGVVLPIAAFAAVVYVVNRMSTESELTVVQATGYSPLRLLRPAIIFGLIITVMMSLLSHFLIPTSLTQLRLRQHEVSRNISAKLLSEGEFLHPAPGVTLYVRDVTPQGELKEVFLSDRRSPETPVTYTSAHAYLVVERGGIKLVMVDGLAQILRQPGNRLFTTHFDDFSYDVSALISRSAINLNRVSYIMTPELLTHPHAVAERTKSTYGIVMSEVHGRFTRALLGLIGAMMGFAALLVGGYSRFGVWRQILLAFALLVLVKVVEGMVVGPVLANGALWPILYMPTLLGALASLLLIFVASRPGLFWRFFARWARAEVAA